MRLKPNCSFYKLPINLDPKQRLLLEAIRYSVNMCFTAWDQLSISLTNISLTNDFEKEKYEAFLYAYSVVDNLDRLNSLFTHLGVVGFDDLRSSIDDIRGMRNTYHHLYDRIDACLNVNFPLLGTLSWTFKKSHDQNSLVIFTMVSGHQIGTREYETLNPLGQTIDLPIGMITLTSIIQDSKKEYSKSKTNLSDIIYQLDIAISKLEKHLENENQKAFQDAEYLQQDLLMSIVIELNL